MSEKKGFVSGFVALIGRPNVGKSTLMNHLIGEKIAITSEKPQTTRNRIRTVYTDEKGQVIFLDTPGIIRARHRLDSYMVGVAEKTLRGVDLILWVVEPTGRIGPNEEHILGLLKKVKTPVILVLNKIDTIKKPEIIRLIDLYHGAFPSAEIVPVSALRGRNTDELMRLIFRYLPEGPQYFDADTITDQPMRQIAAERIREKALRNLSDEVPHGIAVTIDRMKERGSTGFFDIDATIICERESHKGIIIGKNGSMLKKIGTEARMDIESLMGARVNLKLWVKVRKEWRDSDICLKNYGYYDEDGR